MGSISACLSDEDEAEVAAVADLLDVDESTVIRKALKAGLRDLRIRHAVERYQTGDIGTNQAARAAGVTIAEWLEIARDRDLTTQLTPSDLDDDEAAARDL